MPTRIEDSTGKFIEATEDATEVLKGLVASLKGGVGKAKKIGKTGDSEDKLKDAVEKLPEEFVDELKKEFGNIGKMIQEVADFANMMTKKREKAIGLNNKDLNPMEKALATIKKSSTDTYKTFAKKGSGYTHDIYVEAAIKSLNGLVSNLTNILRSGVGSKRRKGKKGGGGSGNADYDMLSGGSSGIDMGSSSDAALLGVHLNEAKETSDYLDQLMTNMSSNMNRIHRSGRWWSSDLNQVAQYGAEMSTEMERLNLGVSDTSKEYERILHNNEEISKYISDMSSNWDKLSTSQRMMMKKYLKEIKEIAKSNATIEEKSEQTVKLWKELGKEAKKFHIHAHSTSEILKGIAGHFKDIAASAAGAIGMVSGFKFIAGVFDGMGEGIKDWVKAGGQFRSLLADQAWAGPGDYFNDLFKVTADTVSQLGQAPNIIRKAWITNLKKGVRNMEDMKETTNSALAMAYHIGSNAEATSDEFQKWNMQLGLSGKQTAVLARNIKQTASDLGIMGDEMLRAVSSARELAMEMRNAGFDAERAADGLIRMTGAAQKFGVEKQMNELASSMSGGLDSYMNASAEMKNLINQAGQGQRVISGKAMSDPAEQRQSTKAVADMLKKEFARYGAVDAQGNVDTSKMTADQLSQLNMLLRRRFGKNMGAGESKRLIEAIEDANMTTDQKMAKLNSQMATNNNLTSAERKAMEEQLKILQERKKQERNTQLVNALDKMREASAKGNPAEAMASMQKALNDQAKQAQARGITLSTDITTTTRESIDSVNERLKKAGKTELKRDDLMRRFEAARAKNDIAGMRSIQEEISNGSALADTGLKENSNVADKMEMAQNKLQASIQSALGNITMLLGALPAMVLILGAIAVSLLGLVKFGAILKSMGADSGKIRDYWGKYWGIASKGNSVHTRDNLGRAVLHKILHELKIMNRGRIGAGKGSVGGEAKLTAAEKRKIKNDEKNRDHGKAQRKHDQKGMAAAKNAKGSGKGGGLIDLIKEKLEMPSFELPKNMKAMATDMIKGAVAIAIIAAGVMALAAVVMKLGQGILAITGLNAEKAMEIGKSVMAVLLAAGLIAVACIAAAYGLKQLNDARKEINVKDVYSGAIFLAILTPAMMLMALVILGMGQVLNSFISVNEAVKIAEGVAAIMMSAAIIALAVIVSAAAMGGLGAILISLSGPQGLFVAGALLAGAAALLILTPAMQGMALAIIGIASGVSAGIDINWAKTTAENVASIMMSAGIIAASVLLMAGSCTVLGLLYPFAPKLALFMLLGAGALMVLTPAMIKLAAVVVDIAKRASQKIDVNAAKETASNVADIMMSAAKIAGAVVLMAASMTILGTLATFAPLLVGFMYLGAGALMVLTPAIIKLSAAIIHMASRAMTAVDPKKGAEVAKNLADFMTSTRSIITEIVEMSGVAGLLGALFTIAVFVSLAMMLGAASISILGEALVFFGKRVMGVGESLASEVNMAKMEDSRKAMESMAAMGAAFSKTIDSLQNNILPLVSKPFLGLFGRSVADKLAEAIVMFSGEGGLIERIVQFFTAIRDGLAAFASDQGIIDNSIKSLEKMNELIPRITAFLGGLGEKLQPLTDGWWWRSSLRNLASKAEDFGAFFRGIGWALYYGMIYPIKVYFPGEQETAQMLVQIDNMSKLMDKVNVSLNQLSNVMNAWITEDWWNSPLRTLRNKTRDFGYFFSGIGWAIRFGMINPIRNSFPALAEMDEMNAFLSAFTDSLNQLATTLDSLNAVTQKLSGANIDVDKINQLQNIAARIANPKRSGGTGISGGGGGETTMGPSFDWISEMTDNTEIQQKKEDVWWTKMLGVLTGVGSPQTSTTGGFGKIMRGSMDTSIGTPINKMGAGINKINDKDATIGDIIRGGDKAIVDAINAANSAIVAAIYASNVIVNVTVDKDKTTTTVNRASASAASTKGNATSGNISDMDDRVAAKVGASRPPAAMQAANEELIKISANTEKLVLIADEQLSRLDEILDSLKVDSSPAPGGEESTMLNTKPRSTPNYYTWRQGRYGDTPVKQYVNPGT
jgi:hypothetical protein